MKIKTYISSAFYILVMCMMISSCKKDELPNKPVPSAFSATAVNGTAIVPAAGATVTISISGGSNGWWIVIPEAQKSWCSVTRSYGSGNIEVPLVIKANSTGLERSVDISVNPTFGLSPAKITFKQAGL